jgi:hypothetical protein
MSEHFSERQVRKWLLGYVWVENTQEAKQAIIDCIIHQNAWKYIDVVADKFAGAQEEPGPEAFSAGTQFALSALYECHSGPHLEACPNYKPTDRWCAGGHGINLRYGPCPLCDAGFSDVED